MAKTKTIRVFELAKVLGVTSKDLVAKCSAEGIPNITNHMSTVSAGLAATIREWFGEGSSSVATAVETAAPVDLLKVRKAKKKPAKPKPTTKEVDARTEKSDATAEVDAKSKTDPAVDIKGKAKGDARGSDPSQGTVTISDPPKVDGSVAPATEGTARQDGKKKAPLKPVMNEPERPAKITPAGPMLNQPMKTTLAGPKVIRVEAPEDLPAPRRKTPTRDEPMARRGPRGGRGVGNVPTDDTTPIRPGVAGRTGRDTASRRNKRRSASAGPERRTSRNESSSSMRSGNWREQDLREREQRLSRAGGYFKAARRDNLKRAAGAGHRAQTAAEIGGKVKVEEPITYKSLSAATGIKIPRIMPVLVNLGHPLASPGAAIQADVAVEVMLEFNIELDVIQKKSAQALVKEQFQDREMIDERPRSPVITILGHVDHGKTSLLDRIRNTNVAEGESGGITQATSAFRTLVHIGDEEHIITFIDTPGHEAFTAMRARGANVTDIVVLVVAADDGVMPQTVESIQHAKAAGVPIVVALNKIDKPEATDTNIQRIMGQLAEHELNPVEWGGETEIVRTCATTGEGVQDLLEVLDYQAQLLNLKADFGGQSEGSVLEAKLEEGRGAVAQVLVQQGKIKKGDFVVVGRAFGRVRDIIDDRGQRVNESSPSSPVTISGINEVPDAGDHFYTVKNLKEAEAAASQRKQEDRERGLVREKVTLDNIFEHLSSLEKKELPLIVKADVQGSVETLNAVLIKIANEEISVSIKHSAVGGINDSDILLASTTGAIIIGFNVTTSSQARKTADAKGVDIRLYDVIYDITDDVTMAAEGMLEPELKLEVIGHSEVREVYKITKVGMVAGCYVTDGVIERHAQIRVTRDGIVIESDRHLEQLRRFKDDVKEVRSGQECGMLISGYDDIKAGDVLECYKTLKVRRKLLV